MKIVRSIVIILGLVLLITSDNSATNLQIVDVEKVVENSSYIVAVTIISSRMIEVAPDAKSTCAIVYGAEVLDTFGYKKLEKRISFISELNLETGSDYILALSSLDPTDASNNGRISVQMFTSMQHDMNCPLEGQRLVAGPVDFSLKITRSIIDKYEGHYLIIDKPEMRLPTDVVTYEEKFKYCDDEREDKCEARRMRTLVKYEDFRDSILKLIDH